VKVWITTAVDDDVAAMGYTEFEVEFSVFWLMVNVIGLALRRMTNVP
jgi:hypothetical protein